MSSEISDHFSPPDLHEQVIRRIIHDHGEATISYDKLLFYAEQVGDEARTLWPMGNVGISVHNYCVDHYPLRSLWWSAVGQMPVWVVFAALRACSDPPWAS